MVETKRNPRRPLSVAKIQALRPREKPYEVADAASVGLWLRVHPSGALAFRWRVRSAALKRVVTIGPWAEVPTAGHVTLADARKWAEELRIALKGGPDQVAAVEARMKGILAPARVTAVATGPTVAEVARRFVAAVIDKRKRPLEAKRDLDKDILPFIGHLPLVDVKKKHVRALVERVVARGSTVHAGKVLGLAKQLLSYAANVEDGFSNEARDLKASLLGVEHNVRSRWLTAEEIPLFWAALDADAADAPTGRSVPHAKTAAALRLLLLTAVRTAELRLARWENVHLESAEWVIPVSDQKMTMERAKTAKPFVVPLSPMASAEFEKLQKLAGHSPFVLPSNEDPCQCYAEKSLTRAVARMWKTSPILSKLTEARPHDLRRTCRTHLARLGVPRDTAEACLNHTIGGIVERTYQQDGQFEARREALLKWDAFLSRLLNPEASNVSFLPVAAAT